MKHCSYCGADYPDEMSKCPVDHESLSGPVTMRGQPSEKESDQEGRERILEGMARRKRFGALFFLIVAFPVFLFILIDSVRSFSSDSRSVGYNASFQVVGPIIKLVLSVAVLLCVSAYVWQAFRAKPKDDGPDKDEPSA